MAEHDAWLVDLDGTLYASSPVKMAILAELSLSGWEVLGTLRRFRSEHELLRRTQAEPVTSPYQLQLERTASALRVAPAQVEAYVREWMIQRPGRRSRSPGRNGIPPHRVTRERCAAHAAGVRSSRHV